jgi:hypothetical protein
MQLRERRSITAAGNGVNVNSARNFFFVSLLHGLMYMGLHKCCGIIIAAGILLLSLLQGLSSCVELGHCRYYKELCYCHCCKEWCHRHYRMEFFIYCHWSNDLYLFHLCVGLFGCHIDISCFICHSYIERCDNPNCMSITVWIIVILLKLNAGHCCVLNV